MSCSADSSHCIPIRCLWHQLGLAASCPLTTSASDLLLCHHHRCWLCHFNLLNQIALHHQVLVQVIAVVRRTALIVGWALIGHGTAGQGAECAVRLRIRVCRAAVLLGQGREVHYTTGRGWNIDHRYSFHQVRFQTLHGRAKRHPLETVTCWNQRLRLPCIYEQTNQFCLTVARVIVCWERGCCQPT